jgi:hypothetical protein
MQLRLQLAAAAVGFSLFSLACSGVTPVNPSHIPGNVGDPPSGPSIPRSTVQRVEEGGGGGGEQCGVTLSASCAAIVLSSESIVLSGLARLPYSSTPLNFSLNGGLTAPPPGGINSTPAGYVVGRFTHGTIQVSVVNGTGNVSVTLVGPFDNGMTFAASGTAPAVQSQSACGPFAPTYGVLHVRTEMTLELRYLGRTKVVVTFDMACLR